MELQKLSVSKRVDYKPELTINLLGAPSIYKNGDQVHLGRHKSVGLLAYLADTGRRVSRRDLSEIFWPDSNPSQSLSALRTVLAEIKSSLGNDILIVENDIIYLPANTFSCDVIQFREKFTKPITTSSMEKKASLWEGGFLKGFDLRKCTQFADWKFLEEQNLQREYRKLIRTISAELAAENAMEKALAYLRESLILDPFDEEAHREIMSLYAAMGNKTAALRQYKICINTLKTEYDFPPEEETQTLAQQIKSGTVLRKTEYSHSGIMHRLPRIAVLPFIIRGITDNVLLDPGNILSEIMTDHFASHPNIEAISRTSTLSYKETTKNLPRIAAELKVDYIVEGVIDILEDNVIIESRLINAYKDSIISINRENFHRLPDNIIPIGTKMAILFLNKLELIEDLPIQKDNPNQGARQIPDQNSNVVNDPGKPWRLYAKHLLRDYNIQNLEMAMNAYNKAIEINPLDADAWAGIAATYSCQGVSGMFGSDMEVIHLEADRAITKALSINPDQPTALMIKGEISSERDRDYESAERYFKRALKVSPENPDILALYSDVLITLGRFKESLQMAERSAELDPVNSWILSAKYWALIATKSYRKADLVVDEIYKYFPHPTQNKFSKAFIQILLGNIDVFITTLEELQPSIISEGMSTFLGLLAYAYATVGRITEAEKLLADLSKGRDSFIGYHMPFASTHIALGNFDLAIDWLEKAEDARDPRLSLLSFIPFYKPLSNLPRYKKLLKRINITPVY